MALFSYKALDAGGRLQTGLMESEAPRHVREQLRAAGLVPLEVDENAIRRSLRLGLTSAQRTETALLPSQLATLLESGLPLAQALEVLGRNVASRALAHALDGIGQAVRRGAALSDALREHERFFDRAFVSMVAAGEASGELSRSLWQLAEYKEKELDSRGRLSSALAYPAFVASAGVLVCGFLVAFVVPRIARVLLTSGRPLPWLTQALLGVGDFVRAYWWGILLVALLAVFGLLRASRGGRSALALERLKFRLPLVGPVLTKAAVARWARTFAVLLRSGLTVSRSLEVLEEMAASRGLSEEMRRWRRRIEAGETLSPMGDEASIMPPLVQQMVALGEKTGELDRILDHLARVYDRECEVFTRRVLALLEPLLIMVLGGGVLVVILAVLLPLLEMNRIL